MNFFQELHETFPDANLRINIMGKNGKYTVAIVPGTKESNIAPITAMGTPEELDAELMDNIKVPLQEAVVALKNVEALQSDIQKLEEETKKKAEDKKKGAAAKSKGDSKKPDSKKADKPKEEKPADEKKKEPANSLF